MNNIGLAHHNRGELKQALDSYQQALPIRRQVGDRAGEAATLNNIGGVYSNWGDLVQALDFYQQALCILREVGDRAGEATTLTTSAPCITTGGSWSRLSNSTSRP